MYIDLKCGANRVKNSFGSSMCSNTWDNIKTLINDNQEKIEKNEKILESNSKLLKLEENSFIQ